jgi:hypothetical protein
LAAGEACSTWGPSGKGLEPGRLVALGDKVANSLGPTSNSSSSNSTHTLVLKWAQGPTTTIRSHTTSQAGGSSADKKQCQHWVHTKTHCPDGPGSMATTPPPLGVPREANKDVSSGVSGQKSLSCSCLCPRHCSLAHYAPICLGHPIPTITHALLVPMVCRGHRSTHPWVTVPSPRDTCPGSTSKWLEPFTYRINGIICQILKIVSKSPFFREANKDL